MKTSPLASSLTALAMLALGVLPDIASAQHRTVMQVASYVPAKAAVGETVYANLRRHDIATVPSPYRFGAMNFRNAAGATLQASVTYHAPELISFKVPAGAVAGGMRLATDHNTSGLPSEIRFQPQPDLPIVALNKILPGILVVNTSQFRITSAVLGSKVLLSPSGTATSQRPELGVESGRAFMFEHILSRSAQSLELGFTLQQSIFGPNDPEFKTQEAIRAVPALSSLLRRETITVRPFLVADILGMGAAPEAKWAIHSSPFHRQMVVREDGSMNVVGLIFPVVGQTPPRIGTLTVDEASAQFTPDGIQFRLRHDGVLTGPVINLPRPYDAFATVQFGPLQATGTPVMPLLFRRLP